VGVSDTQDNMKTKTGEEYQYTIDGKPYTWQGFLKQGKEWGFVSHYDFTSTSMVADYLRKTGHIVGKYEHEQTQNG